MTLTSVSFGAIAAGWRKQRLARPSCTSKILQFPLQAMHRVALRYNDDQVVETASSMTSCICVIGDGHTLYSAQSRWHHLNSQELAASAFPQQLLGEIDGALTINWHTYAAVRISRVVRIISSQMTLHSFFFVSTGLFRPSPCRHAHHITAITPSRKVLGHASPNFYR